MILVRVYMSRLDCIVGGCLKTRCNNGPQGYIKSIHDDLFWNSFEKSHMGVDQDDPR